MTAYLGTGVSRYLDADDKGLVGVIWQEGMPPLDSELNLMGLIELEARSKEVRSRVASGWLFDEINPQKYFKTDPGYNNFFFFGQDHAPVHAVVNGWVIPVGYTGNTSFLNKIVLDPPDSSTSTSVDFIYLEAWLAEVKTGLNLNSSNRFYKYGNTLSGTPGILTGIVDENIGFETTKRIQIQYAIRSKRISNGSDYSDVDTIFNSVTAKGPNNNPTATEPNFTKNLAGSGDPGCYRAGTGVLISNAGTATSTVDGYIYAIPLGVVFRRSHGGVSSASPHIAQLRLKTDTLMSSVPDKFLPVNFGSLSDTITQVTLSESTLIKTVLRANVTACSSTNQFYFKIEDEIILVTKIELTEDTGSYDLTIARGKLNTLAVAHVANVPTSHFTVRPDGLFADQIAKTDILDLRHSIADKFNYDNILKTNLVALLRDNLHTDYKVDKTLKGTHIAKRDSIAGDDPTFVADGVRTIWSDAAVTQRITIPIQPPPVNAVINANLVYNTPTPVFSTPVTLSTSGSNDRRTAGFVAGDIIKIAPPSGAVFVEQKSEIFQGKMAYPVVMRIDGLSGSDVSWDPEVYNPTGTNASEDLENPDTSTNVFTHGRGFQLNIANGGFAELTIPSGSPLISLDIGDRTIWVECVVQYKPGYGLSQKPAFIHQAVVTDSGNTTAKRPGSVYPVTPISESGLMQHGIDRSFAVNAEFMCDPGSKTIYAAPYKIIELRPLKIRTAANLNMFPDIQNGWNYQGIMPDYDIAGKTNEMVDWQVNSSNLFWTDSLNNGDGRFIDIPLDFLPKLGVQHVPSVTLNSGNYRKGMNFIFQTDPATGSNDSKKNRSVISYGTSLNTYYVTDFHDTEASKPYGKINGRKIYGTRGTFNEIVDDLGRPFEGIGLPGYLGFAHIDAIYELNSNEEPILTNLLRFGFNGPTVLLKADENGDVIFYLNRRATKISDADWNGNTKKYVISCCIFGFDRGFLQTNGRVAVLNSFFDDDTIVNVGMIVNAPIAIANITANIDYSYSAYQGSNGRNGKATPTASRGSQDAAEVLKTKNESPGAPSTLELANKQPFEVLAAINFSTSLGTGRISGGPPIPLMTGGAIATQNPKELPEVAGSQLFLSRLHSLSRVGTDDYSDINNSNDPNKWPVMVSSSGEPLGLLSDQMSEVYDNEVPSEWLGATCQLPLGSYLRDKDFTGKTLYQTRNSVNFASIPVGTLSFSAFEAAQVNGLRTRSGWEGQDNSSSKSLSVSGAGNEMLIMVDAKSHDTTSPDKKCRTYRGGSGFSVNEPYSGGIIASRFQKARPNSESSLTLYATAYLVKGAQKVESNYFGNELQMVIVTQGSYAYMKDNDLAHSANGLNMGFTSMDVYRVMGRPLEKHGFQIENSDLTALRPGPLPRFQNKIYDDPIFYGSADAPLIASYQERYIVNTDGEVLFTLDYRPTVPRTVQMFLNGVKLAYDIDYRVVGTQNKNIEYLQFEEVPTKAGDIIEFWYIAY